MTREPLKFACIFGKIAVYNDIVGANTNDQENSGLEQEFDIAMSETLEGEVLGMCNLSEGIFADGLDKGIGIGFDKGLLQAAKNLLDILDDQTISQKLGLSLNVIKDLRQVERK